MIFKRNSQFYHCSRRHPFEIKFPVAIRFLIGSFPEYGMFAFQQRQYLTSGYISFLHSLLDMFTPADPIRVIFSQIIDDLPGCSFCQRELIYSLRFTFVLGSPIRLMPIILIGGVRIVNHCCPVIQSKPLSITRLTEPIGLH